MAEEKILPSDAALKELMDLGHYILGYLVGQLYRDPGRITEQNQVIHSLARALYRAGSKSDYVRDIVAPKAKW